MLFRLSVEETDIMVKSVAHARFFTIAVAILALGLTTACEEKTKKVELPPNKPLVEQGIAKCEKVEERYLLRSLSFKVTDLDGVSDLKKVEARVERFADLQPLVTEAIPLTAEMVAAEELEGPVTNTYAWDRSATGPDFFCGDAGDLLDIAIRAEDLLGYADEILVAPSAL
jgi:hypothetical protein